jgi:hypothetical protein
VSLPAQRHIRSVREALGLQTRDDFIACHL